MMGFKFTKSPEEYLNDFPIDEMIKAFAEYGYTFTQKEECLHKQIVLVCAQGERYEKFYEKDFLVRCHDCDKEFFKIGTKGRKIINLSPY